MKKPICPNCHYKLHYKYRKSHHDFIHYACSSYKCKNDYFNREIIYDASSKLNKKESISFVLNNDKYSIDFDFKTNICHMLTYKNRWLEISQCNNLNPFIQPDIINFSKKLIAKFLKLKAFY